MEYAVWLDMTYGSGPDHCDPAGVTAFSDITIKNLHARDPTKGGYIVRGLIVDGQPKNIPVRNLTLWNVSVTGHNADQVLCTHASGVVHDVHPPLSASDPTCTFKEV